MKIQINKFLILSLLTLMSIATGYGQLKKAEILATGLTCSMCSNAINKQLKALDGVESVETDLNTNTFTVSFRDGNAITPATLKSSVEKAGFFVGSMVVTLELSNVLPKDNTTLQAGDATFVFIDSKEKALNGETKLKIQDKGYITQKEYKKLQKSYSKYPTYSAENENDFHVKVVI
ncbi:heavy-metal-associated domain-containing protein [Flavobacterium sp. MFBS3-15]|uniref:heavy-metal-associated domain-containing protein n=1 Tax=Flavobacterium sp. MFBS3-15 TaxID=2989816 RepID=UPI002235A3EB|nr:heavy-metal-associated domain-containing protein [Flavobacterium sp. MFBS3-15]MCW4469801.1 heavy-metal-associated domain-containing protein [Flavobacterium sp. MFBS3-15]